MIEGTSPQMRRLATPQIVSRTVKPLKQRADGLKSSFVKFCIFILLNNYKIIMKFSEQFEYHKIPEWYSEYMDYKTFKEKIKFCKT